MKKFSGKGIACLIILSFVLGMYMAAVNAEAAHTHSYKTVVTKATFTKDGKIEKKCSCGKVKSTKKIAKVSRVYLSEQDKYRWLSDDVFQDVYPCVYDSDGKELDFWDDFTIDDEYGEEVGTYKITVILRGNYTGRKTLTYTIGPRGTKITKLKAGKKSFSVTLKKQTEQTTGYEIQYAKKEDFSDAKIFRIKNNKKTSGTVKKLSRKKNYYVRVRTYKKKGKKYYYSNWSKTKTVKTK